MCTTLYCMAHQGIVNILQRDTVDMPGYSPSLTVMIVLDAIYMEIDPRPRD